MTMTGPEMPAPKFATARDFGVPTLGTRQGLFAQRMLGQPFMPHQQLISDVTGEMVPTDDPRAWSMPGLPGFWVPRYKLCVITEQRQAGKSHQSMAGNGERCSAVPHFRSWYTAQTGQDARDLFLKFEEENVRGHPLAAFINVKRGRGEEVMGFANGSTLRPHPPTEEKLHGKQSDRNDLDEAWAFDELQGKALMQAIGPTQLTRPAAQTFVWSAGGTAASTWLAKLVARGRAGDPAIAYFEWAIPDDADAEDLDVILAHHPAAGRTVSRDSLRGLRTLIGDDDPAGWARAAGNRWTEIIGGAISLADWKTMRYGAAVPETGRIGYGAARAVDGSHVAIVAAVDLGDGRTAVELLDVVPAFGAARHVAGWATDGPIAIDPNGPSASLYRDVAKARGRKLMKLTGQDAAAAAAHLLDSIAPRAVLFRQAPELDAAVKVAGIRNIGDGGKAWAHIATGSSIAPLEAAGLAVWALAHGKQAPRGRTVIAA